MHKKNAVSFTLQLTACQQTLDCIWKIASPSALVDGAHPEGQGNCAVLESGCERHSAVVNHQAENLPIRGIWNCW